MLGGLGHVPGVILGALLQIGSGSALKSLQLTRLDEIGATQLGTVTVGADASEAREAAQRGGSPNVVVLDERGRPVDFINVERMRGARVENRGVNLITVDSRATLNDALDAMLTSSHGAVVVTGGRGEYRGVASFQQRPVVGREPLEDRRRSAPEGGRIKSQPRQYVLLDQGDQFARDLQPGAIFMGRYDGLSPARRRPVTMRDQVS